MVDSYRCQFPCCLKDMDVKTLKTITGNAATIFTIGVFLAGIEICRKIYLKKSTNEISALPFICGLVSCSFWLRYGLLRNDYALILVNLTGCGLQVIYILWYNKYTIQKGLFYKQLGTALLAIAFLYCYTEFMTTEENARYISGIAACSAGVLFMASPLAAVAHVIKTKNSDTLPHSMIFCSLIMATLWYIYGVLVDDTFVQVPNLLGAFLSLGQMSLVVIYPSKKLYIGLESKA